MDVDTRPGSPESTLTRSFHDANSTIDDLTNALSSLSHVATPESLVTLTCCCGKTNCENLLSWMNTKNHLENRLDLSGQIGQALLQKHDAYVRSHETRKHQPPKESGQAESNIDVISEEAQDEEDERLKQALLQTEELEASKQTITLELAEARTAISRLTAHQARSAGWETRLATLSREKDDMQQERDGEANRAKLAESRLAVMKDKTIKLQSEVRRLQDTLTERAMHRTQSSEDTLRDARSRIAALHQAEVGRTAMIEQAEIMDVLESLVNDNDAMQRDNGELQTALADSREEIQTLKEEIEELRIKPVSRSGAATPLWRQSFSGGVPGSLGRETSMHLVNPRSISIERKRPRRSLEPFTPETAQRPTSPAESTISEPRWSSFSQPEPSSAVSTAFSEDTWNEGDDTIVPPANRRARKPLLLLTRSRGVQTEAVQAPSASPLPSYASSMSPHDPRSESSSYSESPSSSLAVILERAHVLATRMNQADALTLTNRLRRQHLRGADVGHLSRSTVNGIINELANLRVQFRYLLEDDSVVSTCTRKDFRNLFKVLKDIFQELGELRIVLNDIILDPSIAKRVSEATMNPNKAETEKQEKETAGGLGVGAWMAPISKLFSPSGPSTTDRQASQRPGGLRPTARAPTSSRFVPKQRPALSASATTVNVEFTGTGAGRSTTSTVEQHASGLLQSPPISKEPSASSASSGVMNIFAGAPQPSTSEPWVVLPKGPRKMQSFMTPSSVPATGTVGRSATMSMASRKRGLSRDLDAIIDVSSPITDSNEEEPDIVGPLLHRTLRRRGLSDSSIHTTFTSQAPAAEEPRPSGNTSADDSGLYGSLAWPEKMSVFGALSRTVQTLRNTAHDSFTEFTGSLSPSPVPHPAPSAITPALSSASDEQSSVVDASLSSSPKDSPPNPKKDVSRAASPSRIRDLLPALSSWAAAGELMDNGVQEGSLLVGSVRDPAFIQRVRRGPHHGQEFL